MIHREERKGVIVLRMEHGKVNAVDTELCEQLLHHFEIDARSIVLTGSGNAFSAGVDLMKVLNNGNDYIREFLQTLNRALRVLFEFSRPVVAAINGHAIAGGCIIACACDHRIMSEGTGRAGVPELQVGVPFPSLALEILRFALPGRHLSALLYSGKTMVPAEALSFGLIDEIAKPENLLDEACATAEKLASLNPGAFAVTKRQLRQPVLTGLSDTEEDIVKAWTAPETHEIIRAYLDRTLRKR